MKRLLFFCTYIFFSLSFVFAQEKSTSTSSTSSTTDINSSSQEKFHISFEPLYTLQNGVLYEYVYAYDPNSTNLFKLSELDWPLQNISYIGGKVGFEYKHLKLGSKIAFAFPKKSGVMTDYDWLNASDHSMCTNRSISENNLNKSLQFEFTLGLDFNPIAQWHITPFAGYSYNSYDFYSANGFYQYSGGSLPYDDPTVQKITLDKNSAISYNRLHSAMLLGFNTHYTFFENLTFGLSIATTPYIYTKSIDHHFAADKYFLDIMTGLFTQWRFGAYTEFNFWKNFSVTGDFNYKYIIKTYGKTYIHEHEEKFFDTDLDKSGASASGGNWWDLSFGMKIRF